MSRYSGKYHDVLIICSFLVHPVYNFLCFHIFLSVFFLTTLYIFPIYCFILWIKHNFSLDGKVILKCILHMLKGRYFICCAKFIVMWAAKNDDNFVLPCIYIFFRSLVPYFCSNHFSCFKFPYFLFHPVCAIFPLFVSYKGAQSNGWYPKMPKSPRMLKIRNKKY